uniref:Uncharacterized protein n=1 Tax=Pyropia endiviifolia TaxID=1699272 RepID=A0A1S5QMV0_9RHOD|nr:hypothetical protein [Pyropia endiviifolia]
MTFLKNLIELVDPDLAVTALSAGFLATSILVGNYISKPKIVPVQPLECPPVTLKEAINFLAKQKRDLKKLKIDLITFNKSMRDLNLHRKNLYSVHWYFHHYREVWGNFSHNKRHYRYLEKAVTSANYESFKYVVNLSLVKHALMTQSAAMHKLYILKPTLPAALEPLAFVLLVYFLIVHWKKACSLILFLLTCITSLGLYLWWRFLYFPCEPYLTNFGKILYVIYLSFKTFFLICKSFILEDWHAEIDPARVPRGFKNKEKAIYDYWPFHFWP